MPERRDQAKTGLFGICRKALLRLRAGIDRLGISPRRGKQALLVVGIGALYALETQTLGLDVYKRQGLKRFSARRTAGNFDADELRQAVSFCHGRGVKVYVAINTTAHPAEVEGLCDALADVCAAGADAVILQDLAVAALARRMAPDLPIHGSTQMSVHTLEGALELAELGFSRVILARELSLAEIEHIAKDVYKRQ